MKLKQVPQDFVVEEIFDLKSFEERDEERKLLYYYFKLTKVNYNQLPALEKVASVFNTSKKLVHFAGTKDKVGVTSQVISVYGIKDENFERNLEFFNEKVDDLSLEFLGKFKGRINLGDNLGNRFKIVVRDLSEEDVLRARVNLKEIEQKGVLNFFDEQRFGYAGNSHIVGKHVLKNEIESAVFVILTSLPSNPSLDLERFVVFVCDNWDKIKGQDEVVISEAISLAPGFLRSEVEMLKHLGRFKNDFPGAFRKVHKKLRSLYVNAYQSFVFNEVIRRIGDEMVGDVDELRLVSADCVFEGGVKKIVDELLEKDGVSYESFKLPSMPELKVYGDVRKVRVFPKDLKLGVVEEDELNEGRKKVLVEFSLGSGEYATNVIKQLVYFS